MCTHHCTKLTRGQEFFYRLPIYTSESSRRPATEIDPNFQRTLRFKFSAQSYLLMKERRARRAKATQEAFITTFLLMLLGEAVLHIKITQLSTSELFTAIIQDMMNSLLEI